MKKITIGKFQIHGSERIKTIYARRGDKDKSDEITIGNYTEGIFFRFYKKGDNIFFHVKRNNDSYTGYYSHSNELYIPWKKQDLKRILEMVLTPRGIEFIELDYNTRDSVRKKIQEIEDKELIDDL